MTLQSNRLPTTPDLLCERLTRLRSDFPDLFTAEGSLDRDALQALTSEKPDHREHYRFDWAGKHESKRLAFTPSTARLEYDESRSVNPENAKGNMIIEGDNLEVLKLLTSAYRGAVKCIYIDPPYNTGKDFVYSDNYTEGRTAYWDKSGQIEDGVRVDTNSESAGRYHSDWLSMMHSRLLLARGLLRDDGVIFVSIDDHEVHNLRKLMDEVFGEENFVASYLWKKKGTTTNVDGAKVSSLTEYLICYKKSENDGLNYRIVKAETRKYPLSDNEGNYRTTIIEKKNAGAYERKTMQFEIIGHKPREGKRWQIGEETARFLENKKRFILEDEIVKLKIYNFEDSDTTSAYPNLLFENGSTDSASKELKNIFNTEELFDNPKPTELLKQIIRFCETPLDNDIILDFFAGSGTTGQAVMELNQEDGGNRQYILVQLPELTDEKSEAYKAGYKRISDITIERNRRVIERMDSDNQPGFRVLTLARSAFPRVDFISDPDKTDEENLVALDDYIARKEAVFNLETHVPGVMEEVLLKNGFRLDYTLTPVAEITTNLVYLVTDSTGLSAYITLDRPIRSETISYFQAHTDHRFICLEQSLDTTAKWNLRTALGELFVAY